MIPETAFRWHVRDNEQVFFSAEIKMVVADFVNRTAEEWVDVIHENEKIMGIHSATAMETQALHAQMLEFVEAVKPLMDQEVAKIGAHLRQ